jgi:hypothetical protein
MLSWYPQSQYAPCPDCGAPVSVEDEDEHRCERHRYVEYQLLLLRPQIVAFEREFAAWLDTVQGRFASYYALRQRLQVAV